MTTDSIWAVPVTGNNSGEPCYSTVNSQQWCYQAYRWNLDRIEAPIVTSSAAPVQTGAAVTTFYYGSEINYYSTGLSSPGVKPYIRGGYVAAIGYTKISGSEAAAPPAKVIFRVENRCTNLNSSCDTTVLPTAANSASYPDVPTDLICGSASCSKTAPSFFTTKHLVAIDSFVADGSITTGSVPGYRLLDRVRFVKEFPWDGSVDNLRKLFLRNIQRKASVTGVVGTGADDPDACGTSALCTPAIRFDSASLLANRVVSSGSWMRLWRIDAVKDELGAETKVTYGQPDPCSPIPTGLSA